MNSSIDLAPVILFAYKRPNELQQTLTHLQANHLAPASDLYIFVDGPKTEADKPKVQAVQKLVDQLTGFRTIHRQYATQNQGLANSVIAGVTQVINQHGRAIVLEDDLLTAPNFLNFMNQCLEEYKHEMKVFSISGYSFPFDKPTDYCYDGYFLQRPNSWGWATWKNRWQQADWLLSDYSTFKNDSNAKNKFSQGGSDLVKMIHRQQNKSIDSWYIRWCYSQYKAEGITVYPTISKVQNVGFNEEATNTNVYNRYQTVTDKSPACSFSLPNELSPTSYYHRLNLHKYSLGVRLYNRLKTYLLKFRQ